MIVLFAAEAEADLEHIADYLLEQAPSRARGFIRDLREACLGLASIPHAFPLVPQYEHAGIRRRVHGNYLIFYRITGEAIEVVHILHGAMNYEPILFPES